MTKSLTFAEKAAKLAKKEGLYNAMHSCGYINPKPLKELFPEHGRKIYRLVEVK